MTDRLQSLASSKSGPRGGGGFGNWIAGRAGRREYWLWLGPVTVFLIVLGAIGRGTWGFPLGVVITLIWIRRLHDMGWTGWIAPLVNVGVTVGAMIVSAVAGPSAGTVTNALLALGAVVTLGALPGEARDNEFGPAKGRLADLKNTFS